MGAESTDGTEKLGELRPLIVRSVTRAKGDGMAIVREGDRDWRPVVARCDWEWVSEEEAKF